MICLTESSAIVISLDERCSCHALQQVRQTAYTYLRAFSLPSLQTAVAPIRLLPTKGLEKMRNELYSGLWCIMANDCAVVTF